MSDYDDYYSYDYDYDDSVSNVPLEEIIPVGIVYGTTLLLGVIGRLLLNYISCISMMGNPKCPRTSNCCFFSGKLKLNVNKSTKLR